MLSQNGQQTWRGKLTQGHQIASGSNPQSPYPGGSIALQLPHFKERGLDLSRFHPATLNLSIAPATFTILAADYRFEYLEWITGFNPETFSFVSCEVRWHNQTYPAFVYYPHPETKSRDFHNDSLIEIIAPWIEGITYGDSIDLLYSTKKC